MRVCICGCMFMNLQIKIWYFYTRSTATFTQCQNLFFLFFFICVVYCWFFFFSFLIFFIFFLVYHRLENGLLFILKFNFKIKIKKNFALRQNLKLFFWRISINPIVPNLQLKATKSSLLYGCSTLDWLQHLIVQSPFRKKEKKMLQIINLSSSICFYTKSS